MLNETWEHQYKRMLRSHALVRMNAEPIRKLPELDPRDILFHFCCDAFHLRDWIKNSGLDVSITRDVGKLFTWNSSHALAACADIANGHKHLKLTSPPKSLGGYAEVIRRSIRIDKSLGHSVTEEVVEVGGQHVAATDLADKAVADWDEWLRKRGLL